MSTIADYIVHLADNAVVLGQRNAEWCGHGPILEEDLALANVSLDLIGQARLLYQHAATLLGGNATEDSLAYFRDATEFRNYTLLELPHHGPLVGYAASDRDYATTIVRNFLYSALMVQLWDGLTKSSDSELAAIAAKSLKEASYHLHHARDWLVRLGDGTDESRRRLLAAIDAQWPLCPEMLATPMAGADAAVNQQQWTDAVAAAFADATVPMPALLPAASETVAAAVGNARLARAELLAEMQSLARQHAGATW